VRAQRDEAVGLDAPAPAQHLRDGACQVVVAEHLKAAAEELKRLDVRLQERLLRAAQVGLHEARAREAGAHQNR
jgi:hypothetical protein